MSGPAPIPDARHDPPVNVALALERVDADMELLEELVATFLEDLPATLHALAEAVQHGDHAETRRLAHSLRAALGTLGARRGAALGQELEIRARQEEPASTARAWDPFQVEVSRVAAFFEAPDWKTRS